MNEEKKIAAIVAPYTALGRTITSRQIADAIDLIGNLPPSFSSGGVISALIPEEDDIHVRSEASNRLFQRWRKLGLATYARSNWTLTPGSWSLMQLAAYHARKEE